MTPAREAIILPTLLLSVALAGGLRLGATPVLPPPSLFALVLALLLAGVLVQGGVLDPLRLMNGSRPTLANANGLAVLLALVLAGAQVFSLLTPETGVPRVVFSVYFLLQLLNTSAAAPDRVRLLRSLGLTLGAAFVLKFVVLDALSDPAGSGLTRALQLLFEGVTLGTVSQNVQHPAAGYLAFVTLCAFLLGLWMLPGRAPEPGQLAGARRLEIPD